MPPLTELHLVFFLTKGICLRRWDEMGLFEREVALYRALQPRLRRMTFVTYGGAAAREYSGRLGGTTIVSNRVQLPFWLHVQLLERGYPFLWRGPAFF